MPNNSAIAPASIPVTSANTSRKPSSPHRRAESWRSISEMAPSSATAGTRVVRHQYRDQHRLQTRAASAGLTVYPDRKGLAGGKPFDPIALSMCWSTFPHRPRRGHAVLPARPPIASRHHLAPRSDAPISMATGPMSRPTAPRNCGSSAPSSSSRSCMRGRSPSSPNRGNRGPSEPSCGPPSIRYSIE